MTEVDSGPERRIEELPLEELHLDTRNPRLPLGKQGASEDELMAYIAKAYDAVSIARSIAAHGYFPSEALIATARDEGGYTVVEGNRRLVALKGLTEAAVRSRIGNSEEWTRLAETARVPHHVPVVVVGTWADAAPIIGYRHISGIEPWDPFAKSRFIARLVDEDNYGFQEVAALVGDEPGDVRAAYRNHAIVAQAKSDFALDTTAVERGFGVFTRALTSAGIREHVGAPQPRSVRAGEKPLPADAGPKLGEVVSWIFGSEDESPVIEDSRDLDKLGRAIATTDGLDAMRSSRDLQRATEASRGRRQRLLAKLTAARNALKAASEDFLDFRADEEVQERIAEVAAVMEELRSAQTNN